MPHDEFDIPPALADDLADFNEARIFVPAERDEVVLAEARKRLAPTASPPARPIRWTHSPVTRGIAAALIVGVTVAFVVVSQIESPSAPNLATDRGLTPGDVPVADAALLPEDVNRSGTVDIVDALLVAQQAERYLEPNPSFDFTSDGRVTRDDAEFIARRAVALHTPGDAG